MFSNLTDDFLRSTFTVLVWLALVGLAVWYVTRKAFSPVLWIGYAVGGLWLLWVNAANGKQDKTFLGNADQFNEAMAGGPGVGSSVKRNLADEAIAEYLAGN